MTNQPSNRPEFVFPYSTSPPGTIGPMRSMRWGFYFPPGSAHSTGQKGRQEERRLGQVAPKTHTAFTLPTDRSDGRSWTQTPTGPIVVVKGNGPSHQWYQLPSPCPLIE
jgi:hypothetical protein